MQALSKKKDEWLEKYKQNQNNTIGNQGSKIKLEQDDRVSFLPNTVVKESRFLVKCEETINNIKYEYTGIHVTNVRELIFSTYFKKYLERIPSHNLCLPSTIQITKKWDICQYLPNCGGTLQQWKVENQHVMTPVEYKFWTLSFIFQIAETLSYLQPHFIHGSLRSKNILIQRSSFPSSSFPLFTSYLIDYTTSSLANGNINNKNDVCSLALCLLYTLEGSIEKENQSPIFKSNCDRNVQSSNYFIPKCFQTKTPSTLFLHEDKELLHLVLAMLRIDESKRISMEDVKNYIVEYFLVKKEHFHFCFKKYFSILFPSNENCFYERETIRFCFLYPYLQRKNNTSCKNPPQISIQVGLFHLRPSSSNRIPSLEQTAISQARKQFITYIRVLNYKFSSVPLLPYCLILYDIFYFSWRTKKPHLQEKKRDMLYLACSLFYICFFLYDNRKPLSFYSLYQTLLFGPNPKLRFPLPTSSTYTQNSLFILSLVIQVLLFFSFDILHLSISSDKKEQECEKTNYYFALTFASE